MKIKWWGHASFSLLITGVKIITDPYGDELPIRELVMKLIL